MAGEQSIDIPTGVRSAPGGSFPCNDLLQNDAYAMRKSPRRYAFIACLSIAILAWAVFISMPERLHLGRVIDQFGTYRFPNDSRTLKITKDEYDNVTVTVRTRTTRFEIIPYWRTENLMTFESERDWFITIDEYQRIWTFLGHWDQAWPGRRAMPSGGWIPYAPAVLLDGVSFYGRGELCESSQVVTETGNWAGVPQEFFDRLPGRDDAQWGNTPVIPPTAPRFTKYQETQIASRLQRPR